MLFKPYFLCMSEYILKELLALSGNIDIYMQNCIWDMIFKHMEHSSIFVNQVRDA